MEYPFEVNRLGGALGARIEGLDLTRPLLQAELQGIERALMEHQVLAIHAPNLAPEQHMALGRQFGTIERHAFFPNLGPGYEEVSVLDSVGGARADSWHADESFLKHPLKVTMTHAKILPTYGGDTCFTSMTAAYEALSPAMKRYLEGMKALHDCAKTVELGVRWGAATYEQYIASLSRHLRYAQPMVITHPVTGRKAIFVNETYTQHIVGVAPDESTAVLKFLYEHVKSVQYMYRHRWLEGDLLMWDNIYTQHFAVFDYPGQRRCMYRVSVVGDRELS